MSREEWEHYVDAFDAAWKRGPVPSLVQILHELPADCRHEEALVEFVAIDLEYRWRAARNAALTALPTYQLPTTPILSDYSHVLPAWTTPLLDSIELVVAEFRIRQLFGDRPPIHEYTSRFGERHPELDEILSSELRKVERERGRQLLRKGTRLGHFEIMAHLGSGGMGVVYRAQDTRLGREVAIKVLSEQFVADPIRLARFHREARAVANLSHPNIVVLHDIGEQDGIAYVVTELLTGRCLHDVVQEGPMPWPAMLKIALALAEGVAAAHRHSIIHRDLKPANVVFSSDGHPKILDFGLARRLDSTGNGSVETASQMTTPGSIMGTLGYMAPEQLRGQTVDERADIFSLGCIFYAMLVGKGPFDRASIADTSAATLHETPPIVGDIVATPPDLTMLVMECLEKSPQLRPQRAADIVDRLNLIRPATTKPPERASLDRVADGSTGSLGGEVFKSAANELDAVAPQRDGASGLESLAVIPLANETGDEELDYLADGIAESIIFRLLRLPDLRVMAWSTVSRYRSGEHDGQELGRKLEVAAVLCGRLLLRGPTLVVRLELVSSLDGSLVWADQFRSKVDCAYELEADIARQIGEQLRGKLSAAPAVSLAPRNAQAYQHYLNGRLHWNRRNSRDLAESIRHFELAISHDPQYGRAYAGLADSYGLLIAWGDARPREAFPIAREIAVKALELDPTLAEAHTSLGYISVVYEWDFGKAEKHYRMAISTNPNYATARHWLGYLLMLQKRFHEAEEETRVAQSLDPLSPIIAANIAFVSFFAGQLEEAATQLEKTESLDSRLPSVHYYMGLVRQQQGRMDEALDAFRRSIELSNGVPGDVGAYGHALASSGRREDAESTLQGLADLKERNFVTQWNEALVYLGLGDKDRAYALFDEAREERDFYHIYLDCDPRLADLRDETRFRSLRQRVFEGTIA